MLVDWHNYGHTILAMALRPEHPLVRLCYWIEGFFGRRAYYHFCVTKAMQKDLLAKWGIR